MAMDGVSGSGGNAYNQYQTGGGSSAGMDSTQASTGTDAIQAPTEDPQIQGAMASSLAAATQTPGQTALSPPARVISPGAMGNLTTADLIQVIRTTGRATAKALIEATAEMIKSQVADIKMKSNDKIAKLQKCITDLAEAERKMKEMEAIKIAMYCLGGLICLACCIAAVFTGGATLAVGACVMAAISTATFITTVCLSEIKDENGESTMDKAMKDLAKACEGMYEPEGSIASDDVEGDSRNAAMGIMLAVQVLIMIAMILACNPGAAASQGANSGVQAAKTAVDAAVRTVAETVEQTVKQAMSRIVQSFESQITVMQQAVRGMIEAGVKGSMEALGQALATSLRNMVSSVGNAAQTVTALGGIAQGGLGIAQGENQQELAEYNFSANTGKAEVEKLKELIKLLSTLISADQDWIKSLMQLQAKLDGSVNNIIHAEHKIGRAVQQAMAGAGGNA